MMKRWIGILPLAILAGCSNPDPAALVGPIEDQVGVGLALNKDCKLLTDRQYAVLFGYVMETFDLMGSDRFSAQIDKAQEIQKQYGCQSAEVAAIAQVPVLMYSLNEQARQAEGATPGQPAAVAQPVPTATAGQVPAAGEAKPDAGPPLGAAPTAGEAPSDPPTPALPAPIGMEGQGAVAPIVAPQATASEPAPAKVEPVPASAGVAAPAGQ